LNVSFHFNLLVKKELLIGALFIYNHLEINEIMLQIVELNMCDKNDYLSITSHNKWLLDNI